MQRILNIAAIVLFVLTAALVVLGAGDKTLLQVLPLAGLACFAGAHA